MEDIQIFGFYASGIPNILPNLELFIIFFQAMNDIKNRKATQNYFIRTQYEAGLVLQGWEVKSIRTGHAQLSESHINVINGEFFIIGMHLSPLHSASSHVKVEPMRMRKILLKTQESNRLIGKLKKRGCTLVPLSLTCNKRGFIKLEFAEALGKKLHDKRETIKERTWSLQKSRIMKIRTRHHHLKTN